MCACRWVGGLRGAREQVIEVAAWAVFAPCRVPGPSYSGYGTCAARSSRSSTWPRCSVARAAPPRARLLVTEVAGRRAGFAIDGVTAVGELADPAEENASGLPLGTVLGPATT